MTSHDHEVPYTNLIEQGTGRRVRKIPTEWRFEELPERPRMIDLPFSASELVDMLRSMTDRIIMLEKEVEDLKAPKQQWEQPPSVKVSDKIKTGNIELAPDGVIFTDANGQSHLIDKAYIQMAVPSAEQTDLR